MGKRPNIIREGDRARIIVPKVVVRVGYPKAVSDYLETAKAKFGAALLEEIGERVTDQVLQKIAYGLALADGFGGRERSLHLKDVPDLLGQEFTVGRIRTVQTGTYYPPRGGYDYYGDYDHEPGGLENMKARRLATGFMVANCTYLVSKSEIPVEHLEKVT